MLNIKFGWIVGVVYLTACFTVAAGQKPENANAVKVQTTAPNVPPTAIRSYIKGLNLYEQDRFDAAVKAFREAFQISSDWKILYHIGKCELALKRYGVAGEVFEAYLEKGGYNLSKAREIEVRQMLDALEKLTGRIEIKGMPGAKVYINGLQRGTLPLSKKLAISSGVEHKLTIQQGEIVRFERVIQVAQEDELLIAVPHGESEFSVLRTQREPVQKIDYVTARAKNDSRRKRRAIALGVVGFGALGMVGGLVAGRYAKHKWDALVELCDDSTTCVATPARTQKYRDAESAANAATVMFTAGATMAVVGTILLIVLQQKSKRAPLVKSVQVQMQPARGGALVFSREF